MGKACGGPGAKSYCAAFCMANRACRKASNSPPKVGPRQAEGHRGLQKADLRPAIIALATESQAA